MSLTCWEINNQEIEFDIFDLDNAKSYEKAFENMSKAEKAIKKDGSMSDFITSYCDMYFGLFSDLFGEDKANMICNKRYNSNEWEKVYDSFLTFIENQNKSAIAQRNKIAMRKGNRAQRRAAQKLKH